MGTDISLRSRVRGCLLGGAMGDALGGAITGRTQMTLFTAEGLLRAYVRQSLRGICSVPSVVGHAYLRWMLTQGVTPEAGLRIGTDGWLWGVSGLHRRSEPNETCLSALASMRNFGAERAGNESRCTGAIARVAPVALVANAGRQEQAGEVFQLAKTVSWITHGDPSGYLPAAAFAVMVHGLLWGEPLPVGIERARALLQREEGSGETLAAMGRATACAEAGEAFARTGGGGEATEALGAAVFRALTNDDFAGAVRAAGNDGGDSHTAGELAGQLVGAARGEDALPADWLRELELRETICAVADDLAGFRSWDMRMLGRGRGFADGSGERYPGW
jgi:ADP-ribosylglycohydrolase